MRESSESSQPATATATTTATEEKKKIDEVPIKRFNNGWTSELENLVGEWADKAQCYRWMHDKTSRIYASYNQYMMIPVIVLSTLTGTANFGLDSLFGDANSKRLASLGIGGVGILTGIISTVANFLRYGQGSESHSISSIAWAKFGRFISIELALNPNERMEAFAFLKMFRIELDRLIEQSPSIPDSVIRSFKQEFRMMADVKRPEITGAIEHTRIFDNKNQRLKAIAAEAALMLSHKKMFVKELALADLDNRVREIVKASLNPSLGFNPLLGNNVKGPTKESKKESTNKISEPLPGTVLEDDTVISVDGGEDVVHLRQYDKT